MAEGNWDSRDRTDNRGESYPLLAALSNAFVAEQFGGSGDGDD